MEWSEGEWSGGREEGSLEDSYRSVLSTLCFSKKRGMRMMLFVRKRVR